MFRRFEFDIDITAAKGCLVAGVLLLAVAAVLFRAVFKQHGGKTYAYTAEEINRIEFHPSSVHHYQYNIVPMKGVGRGARLTLSIGALREAALHKDWLTFWGTPAMFFCGIAGVLSLMLALMFAVEAPLAIMALAGGFVGLMALGPLFMMWAALYTNLEADVAPPPIAAPPPERDRE